MEAERSAFYRTLNAVDVSVNVSNQLLVVVQLNILIFHEPMDTLLSVNTVALVFLSTDLPAFYGICETNK